MTQKERFINLVSEKDSKIMEDVKRRRKYRDILKIISKFRLKMLMKNKK